MRKEISISMKRRSFLSHFEAFCSSHFVRVWATGTRCSVSSPSQGQVCMNTVAHCPVFSKLILRMFFTEVKYSNMGCGSCIPHS